MTSLDTSAGRYAFHVFQGPDLKSLRELMECLGGMPAWQYGFHVSAGKNDFATWVEGVFHDGQLARRMRSARSQEELRAILEDLGKPSPAKPAPSLVEGSPSPIQEASPPAVQAPVATVTLAQDGAAALPLMDDRTFGKLRDEYTGRNEQMYDRFDTVAQKIKASLEDPLPEKYEKLAEKLVERSQELKLRMSALRKEGKDAFLPMLMLRPFAAKLSLAKVTRESADFERVKILLDQVEAEIADVARTEPLDVRKEVERLAAS